MENYENNNNPFDTNEERKDAQPETQNENLFVSGSGAYEEQKSSSENPYAGYSNPYSNPYNRSENRNSYDQQEHSAYNNNPYSQNPYTTDLHEDDKKKDKKGLGIASMVLGILSVTVCCCSVFGLIVAIVGLILGIVSQVKKSNGFALAGIITSAFGIAFGVLGVVILATGLLEEIMTELENAMESSFGDSGFDNNNNAIINAVKFVVRWFSK